MDRVLIVSDDVAFIGHIENTLKQVGFEVAQQSNEVHLQLAIDSFTPEMIIVKGDTPKLSTLRVGQILKEVVDYKGKIILIMNTDQKIDPADFSALKMDYLLFEPVGAVKVISHVLNLMSGDREVVRKKLLNIAQSDSRFRENEGALLVSSGKSIEEELIYVTGYVDDPTKMQVENISQQNINQPQNELDIIKSKFMQELTEKSSKYSNHIESYNKAIAHLNVDLKTGHNKKHTHSIQKKLRAEFIVDSGKDSMENLDRERRKFAVALVKKDK
ncbi:MAG: hypothetical protein ACK41T_11585 [Pseudobdellovibrio sp.]